MDLSVLFLSHLLSLANSEARHLFFNIVADCIGGIGVVTNMAVSRLASKGSNIGKRAQAVVNTISIAQLLAMGAKVVNTCYEIYDRWIENQTVFLTMFNLIILILLFIKAFNNFKTCSTMVEESQRTTLQDYKNTLSNNQHRKTFENLKEETIRRNNDNEAQGMAEVISAVRNIHNKNEVFQLLTRNQRTPEENSEKFYVFEGQIILNGQPINLNEANGVHAILME